MIYFLVLVEHFHRLTPDPERYRKVSIFPASLTQTDAQCESLLPKEVSNRFLFMK